MKNASTEAETTNTKYIPEVITTAIVINGIDGDVVTKKGANPGEDDDQSVPQSIKKAYGFH